MLPSEINNNITDPRRAQGKRFDLVNLVLVIVIALISNAKEYSEIHTFVSEKFRDLKELLDFNWRIAPSYSTLRRIIISIDLSQLELVLEAHGASVGHEDNEVIAIDGKALRGSGDRVSKPLQAISAFLSGKKIVLGQVEIENGDKTNEIPKVREILKRLNLNGKVITMDAMHCQTDTLKLIKYQGGDAVVQVKDNQKTLKRECEKLANNWIHHDTHETKEASRDRIEYRKADIFRPNAYFAGQLSKGWDGLIEDVIKVDRRFKVFNKETKTWERQLDTSYYISTKDLSADEALRVVRKHWEVENSLHYVRDVTMREDNSQIKVRSSAMSKFRTIALNVMRLNGVENVKSELYRNSLNIMRIKQYTCLLV